MLDLLMWSADSDDASSCARHARPETAGDPLRAACGASVAPRIDDSKAAPARDADSVACGERCVAAAMRLFCGRAFRPDAFRSGRGYLEQKRRA
ncbi:hypothetical protein RDV84_17020 [Lysobacter yananisis]|uniref:Uncharacterized protein n=1 Tax=Lysobacter yananisis TaxID=1003114 RepID=A0ABY9P3S4_9GAMM|nr:hypothetical protein [Lysobacter yananisis]WMT01673.1 hypothetical protein RDV84_17020 [Lysobacter yananisis]